MYSKVIQHKFLKKQNLAKHKIHWDIRREWPNPIVLVQRIPSIISMLFLGKDSHRF